MEQNYYDLPDAWFLKGGFVLIDAILFGLCSMSEMRNDRGISPQMCGSPAEYTRTLRCSGSRLGHKVSLELSWHTKEIRATSEVSSKRM